MRLQANVLYSGADDCTFKGWDIRCPAAVSTTSSTAAAVQHPASSTSSCTASSTAGAVQEDLIPSTEVQHSTLFSNRRAHGAGVCCISSHPRREHTLVTGSYDECIRLWDVRALARPVETCQVRRPCLLFMYLYKGVMQREMPGLMDQPLTSASIGLDMVLDDADDVDWCLGCGITPTGMQRQSRLSEPLACEYQLCQHNPRP
jgi:hypothetical protein